MAGPYSLSGVEWGIGVDGAGLSPDALGALNQTMALALFGADGRYEFASDQWCELFGSTRDELLGRPWIAFCDPEDVERVSGSGELTRTTGATVRIEFRRRPPSSGAEPRWIGASLTALQPDDPETGWFATAADITDRLRDVEDRKEALEALQRSNRRLASLVENLQIGVLLVGPDRRVVASNQTFCDLLDLGRRPERLVDMAEDRLTTRVSNLAKEPERELEVMARLRGERSGPQRSDVPLLDGGVLERTYVPIDDAEDQGHLWLFRDVTDERQMVARQIQLLAQEQLQNDRLRELDSVRREFATLIAHEFRTPLTSIIGYSEMLELEDSGATGQGYVDVVQRNADRLLRLVNDLLELDRLEERTLPAIPDDIDMAEVVSMAVSSLRPIARERGISLQATVRSGPALVGDAERLGQMVDNLLANALKFSSTGDKIRVAASPMDEGWSLSVSDTGIGIPAEEIPDLFERFYRASNAKQLAIRGSGLGLAIVRAIVDQHRGSISVESEEGFGTTFRVQLRGLLRT